MLITQVFDASACAGFVNAKGRATVGLLPNNRLQAPTPHFRKGPAALVGDWTRTEADVAIKQQGRDGILSFRGVATWGGFDKGSIERGAVNVGDFEFSLKPVSNRVDVSLGSTSNEYEHVARENGDPDDCAVSMIGLGPYLVVEDNLRCGGMNVSFAGVYRRSGE